MSVRGRTAIEQSIRNPKGKTAFIPFVVGGDPDFDTSLRLILELAEFSDVIEVGFPYSDPLADGPVIQAGSLRALQAGMNLPKCLELIRKVREKTDVPLIAFTYVNPVVQYGMERLAAACQEAGADGLIVPDLPFEESDELQQAVDRHELALIPLVAPTSGERVKKVVASARGFLYCVSSLGVTGERGKFMQALESFVQNVKSLSNLPVAVGFGISQPKQVAELSSYADGVIVGSAIVRRVQAVADAVAAHDEGKSLQAIRDVATFAKGLARAGFDA